MSAEMDRMRERINNQTTISGLGSRPGDAGDINSPAFQLPAYNRQKPRWQLADDLWAGTERLREAKETYLPRGQAEAQKDYDRRMKTAVFYNVYKRTIKGLTGLAFRKSPMLSDGANALIAEDWEDIDLTGTAAPVFIKQLFETGAKYGHVGILVDYPTVPADTKLSVNQERSLGLRPYWIAIEPHQILNWRTMQRGGQTILQQVTLHFKIAEPSGAFGSNVAEEYRVYQIADTGGVWLSIFQKPSTSTVKELQHISTVRINNQTEIPLAIGYLGDKEAVLESCSALHELGHTNLDHYRVLADHRHSLHKASIPILVFKNRVKTANPEEIVNPDWGIDVTGDGDVYYREHAGSALGQTRTEIQDIEQRMASQGLSLLHRDTRTAETATANKLDKAEQNSTLGTMVRAVQDCVNQALKFHANFRKVAVPETEFNYDFDNLVLDAGIISVLSQLEVAGQVTLDTLWTMLERGGVLPDGFDKEEELAALLKSGARPDPTQVPDPSADPNADPNADPQNLDGGAGD